MADDTDPFADMLRGMRRRGGKDSPAPDPASDPAPKEGGEDRANTTTEFTLPTLRAKAGDLFAALAAPGDKEAGETGAEGETGERRSLRPRDLLAMPEDLRTLVTWLTRNKQAQLSEIKAAFPDSPVHDLLARLMADGFVHEALIDGTLYYRVAFGGNMRKATSPLPHGIWERIDLDNSAFLAQIPIFAGMNQARRRELADRMEARHYHRDEVILWQGRQNTNLYFIKSGIVGLTRLSPHTGSAATLVYLKQGEMLGEYSLLTEGSRTASATATALSEVDVLIMREDDFLTMLQNDAQATLALARMLVQRLTTTGDRVRDNTDTKLALVLSIAPGSGGTCLGSALAMTLGTTTGLPSVYTEYPKPHPLARQFGFDPGTEYYHHGGGFDVYIEQDRPNLPATVRTTLLLDELTHKYANVVIGLSSDWDETLLALVENAHLLVIVTTPDQAAWDAVDRVLERLGPILHPDRTNLYIITNRPQPAHADLPAPVAGDFELPPLPALPALPDQRLDNLPTPLVEVLNNLADRLGRTNQINIYLPTTIEGQPLAEADDCVERALAFFGRLFGGATSTEGQRVQREGAVGLINEPIITVRSYATQRDIDRHLREVLAFAEEMKSELKQDAIVLEVNQRLMLV
jgi:CRP-like cAMP-binding protein